METDMKSSLTTCRAF